MANIICSGPGPHVPASGILGTTDKPGTADVRCAAKACEVQTPPNDPKAELLEQVRGALEGNEEYLAAEPDGQAAALTTQVNALIRLVLGQLDSDT